jgi:uncharacterized protein (TIGR00106 family)
MYDKKSTTIYLAAWLYYILSVHLRTQEVVMNGQVVAEVSIVPVGTSNTSVSRYVADSIQVLEDRKDLTYRLTPMGTVIEGQLDRVLEAIQKMHEVPFIRGALRVVTSIRIDDRRDKTSSMSAKVQSVLKLRPSTKT